MFNIPNIFGSESKNILFAGIGGGFDVFSAIPLWINLRNTTNRKFVFSNYNPLADKFSDDPKVYPEKQLHQILKANEFDVPVYTLPKVGVKTYIGMYEEIIKKHNIDTIVAMDGGVDSLMQGDEEDAGTILEDFVSMIAINKTSCKNNFLICSGFGTELEEGLCHHHILENISSIIKRGGFLGTCSLIDHTDEFKFYKSICEYVWNQGRKSHIQTKIISSVMGMFGDDNLYDGIEANVTGTKKVKNYLSSLMSMYWFFTLSKVLEGNVLYKLLENTISKTDVLVVFRQTIDTIKKRQSKQLPY